MIGKIKQYLFGTGVILCLLVALNTGAAWSQDSLLQQGISDAVIRFHVLANSNSEEDQRVKLEVRDSVMEFISNHELANDNKAEMKCFIEEHLKEIEKVADQTLKDAGMSYNAHARIEQCYFPERTYGDCTFPAGWYEALRIFLGEADGQNWWCVLYPQICFADCLHAVMEEDPKGSSDIKLSEEGKQDLKAVLTVEEYESLLLKPREWKIGFRWF